MILLTGANGHLGANLVRRLIADGHTVRVLLRRDSDNSTLDHLDVERVLGDLRDPDSLIPATLGVSKIYHCAAQISTTARGENAIFENNVLGTRNLLRAAMRNGVERIVVSGSLSAVGHRADAPTDETEPFNPFERHLPYAVSKAAVEHECLKAVADGLDVVIATSCAILGPYDFKPSRMGQVLLDYANGRLRAYVAGGFEFVATRDIVEGHVLAMHKGRRGQRYIFSTEFITLDALFDLFQDVTGRPKPRRLPAGMMMAAAEVCEFVYRNFLPGHRQLLTPAAIRILRMGRRASYAKAETELGYRPTSIEIAVREAYAWFRERGAIKSPPSPVKRLVRVDPSTGAR